jgi:U3 small nucleolar RNA-associated protein 19
MVFLITYSDPYLMDEIDPSSSNASESSLWELQLLSRHYSPIVSGMGKIFEHSLAKPSFDLEEFFDHTYKTVN